ncbi:MAG: hypothetical protein ABIT83_06530 [Massilia sp.]
MSNTIQDHRLLRSALDQIKQLKTEQSNSGHTLDKNEYEKLVGRILTSLHKKLSHGAQNSKTSSKGGPDDVPEQKPDPVTQAPPAPSTPGNMHVGTYSLSESKVRVDSVGTNYISDGMLRDAKSKGGQLKTKAEFDAFIDANAAKFGLDPEIVKREYRVESTGDPTTMGDANRNWSQGGPSIGLLQVTSGILAGGVWATPGMTTSSGVKLSTTDLKNSTAVQLLAGMQHLADYKNQAGASLGAGASPQAIYTKALGNYVGHDQAAYIHNIENTKLS